MKSHLSLFLVVSKSTEVVLQNSVCEAKPLSPDSTEKQRVELPALTWVRDSCLKGVVAGVAIHKLLCFHLPQPAGHHIIVKIIWAIQWPFSLLRWLTVPPFCQSVRAFKPLSIDVYSIIHVRSYINSNVQINV